MKTPSPRKSEPRTFRREMMMATGVLVLAESGIGSMAHAMDTIAAADALKSSDEEEQPEAKKSRPGGAKLDSAASADPDQPSHEPRHTPTGIDRGTPVFSDTSDDEAVDISTIGAGDDAGFSYGGGAASTFDPYTGRAYFGVARFGRPNAPDAPSLGQADGTPSRPDRGESAHDPQSGGDSFPVLLGGDNADVLTGTAEADYMFGGAGDDLMIGGPGRDRLLGGKGNDSLVGGAGNDLLSGDKGNDQLSGGGGNDTFIFRSGFGHDVIADFGANGDQDVIDLAKAEFANFAALLTSIADSEYGAMITLHDGSTLTLYHQTKDSLSAADFRFMV